MCILTILDASVDLNIISRELITQTNYNLGGILNTSEVDIEYKLDFLKKGEKDIKNNSYKTVYLYQLKRPCTIKFSALS